MSAPGAPYDLLLKGGTLLDPGQGLHQRRDVAFHQGRVAAVEERVDPAGAREVLDVRGKLVTPGLVDIHGHYYHGTNLSSVNPRESALPAGVTTAVDGGSAGWANYPALRDYVAPASGVRLLAFLYIGAAGQLMSRVVGGELRDIQVVDVERTAQHVRDNPGFLFGVKVRMHVDAVAHWDARRVLRQAREAADKSGSLLMVHSSFTPIPLVEILEALGPGDILTHAFNGNPPETILDANNRVRPQVRAAAERGVVMDVAHAGVHFNINVFRHALSQGLSPTTISTDINNAPPERAKVTYQLHELMGNFVALGLSLEEAVTASTLRPAQVLGLAQEVGSLKVGMAGDAAVFDLREGRYTWGDLAGNTVEGSMNLDTFATIRDGAVVWRRVA